MANHGVGPSKRSMRGLSALFLALAIGFPAHAGSPWRSWSKADGLAESWTFGLSLDSEGRVMAKHGDVATESVLDGYQITGIPSQHAFGRLRASPEKEIWSFDAEGILIYDTSGWHKYPVPEIAEFAKASQMQRVPWFLYQFGQRMDVLPVGDKTGVILFPDRLVEWSRVAGRKRTIRLASQTALSRFADALGSADGVIWIAGDKGLARLRRAGNHFDWTEVPVPGQYSQFRSPVESKEGEIFLSAGRRDGKRAVIRFANGEWTEVFAGGSEPLTGWRAADGTIWIQKRGNITPLDRLLADTTQTTGALGGTVLTDRNNNFWIGNAEGVARYSPPLWRTPPSAAWADGPVKSIVGDASGRTWFLTGKFLVLNDHDKWRRFPLPEGQHEALLIDDIRIVESGELVMRAGSLADIVVFNPVSENFRFVRHPQGKRTGALGRRQAGGLWVQVFVGDGIHWGLEPFDGVRFPGGGPDHVFEQSNLRVILEARNGDIWTGSTGALGLLRGGSYRRFDRKDGFIDTGVFSAVETPGGHILLGGRESVSEYDGRTFRTIKNIDLAESMSLARDGTIWTASGSGVHRFRPGQWITNTTEDGLPSASVHEVHADASGRVWVGTSLGISLFYPGADPDPPITRILDDQNLRETPPGGEVRMVFSGIDKWKFTSADRLEFSWRMDDAPWSDFSPSHFASFKRLNSGAHHFEVRAMDRNGNVETRPAIYGFSVLLPWYLQTSFLILAVIAVSAIGCLSRLARRHHRRLRFQSRHDPLTGLANRAVFELDFQQAITTARAGQTGVAIILLDLDRFKPINDTLGHVVGDRFLQEVSKRLRSAIREQDTLARLGGDEFAIVMPGLPVRPGDQRKDAELMARNILALLRQPYLIDSFELSGSASVGVSLFPEHGDDTATLQRLADMAMYQCKAQNKDQYAVFDPRVNRLDFRSAQMAGLIRAALDDGNFRLHYQPLRAGDGELVGFEALIRLEHPEYGTIPPSDFIPIAEDTGLIIRVGDWVLAEACRQMAQWHAWGHRRLRVNVNVSTVQLTKPDFAERVRSILGQTGLNPCALTLEITETAIMRNWEDSLSQIVHLRTMGITIALDDFGTGYSTLSSLHMLPIDYIKIDRCFVERLGQAENGLIVIQAIAQLAEKFGFEVVAEGVETPTQLAGLRSIGCDFFQGYLLGRPTPADDAGKLLESERGIAQPQTAMVTTLTTITA
jgi:diguanylate cyclase (GGDEF)-like protein